MSDHLSGTVERVTFHNPENGFAVLRAQVKGHRGLVTVVGKVTKVIAGEHFEADGSWQADPEHGMQFRADELRTTPPQTAEGIEKYLASGLVRGIGPHYAKKIVEVFGDRTLSVIDESPTYLSEVKGLGPRRLQQIRESWQEQKAVRDIMIFLQSHGVGSARAVRIYKTYGRDALDIVRADPYRLANDIWGIGFHTADQIAESIGIARNSPLRARAAVLFVLQRLTQEGHCAFPRQGVVSRVAELTGIAEEVVQQCIESLIKEDELVLEDWRAAVEQNEPTQVPPLSSGEPWLYLRRMYFAEQGVARTLQNLLSDPHPLADIDTDAALQWTEQRMKLELAAAQRDAVRQATTSKVLIITGGPGVGKSTIVRGILEIFNAKKLRVGLCAPTGRAAKRLAETSGREAKTIHRLLEIQPGRGFRFDADNRLPLDLIIIDEASMLDISLMYQLVRAIPDSACLILVGDVHQLPSVGAGMVLNDIIESQAIPVVRLTQIFRQAQESGIVRAAYEVFHGQPPQSCPPEPIGDFYYIEVDDPSTIIDRILTMLADRIPKRFKLDPLRDVQVLTPMNRSELGARALNLRMQQVLNPPMDTPEVQRFGWTFRIGDKALQTVNNYDKGIFNGDIGRVAEIDMESQELTVDYDGQRVAYDFGELDELSLAYALTIHKSQGSEYPAVIVPLHTQHYLLLQRNLLYTSITRGKRLVVLVGSRKALGIAVHRQETINRCTALAWRITQIC